MKLKIKVTKKILEESSTCGIGFMSPASNCAIALAVREIFPDARVLNHLLYPIGAVADNDFPHGMDRFIREFDKMSPAQRRGLMEFHFYLDIPEKAIDLIGLSEVHRILKESKTLELV